jgi:hypothetical protein
MIQRRSKPSRGHPRLFHHPCRCKIFHVADVADPPDVVSVQCPAHHFAERFRHQALPPSSVRQHVTIAEPIRFRRAQIEGAPDLIVLPPHDGIRAGQIRRNRQASGDIGLRLRQTPMRPPRQEASDIPVLGIRSRKSSGIGGPDWPQDQSGSLECVREHGRMAPQINGGRPRRQKTRINGCNTLARAAAPRPAAQAR